MNAEMLSIRVRDLEAEAEDLHTSRNWWMEKTEHLTAQLRDKDARIKEDSGVIQDLFEEAKKRDAQLCAVREALGKLLELRASTDATYESAYQAMFKSMGRAEWAAAEQALSHTSPCKHEADNESLRDRKCECEWCPVHSLCDGDQS